MFLIIIDVLKILKFIVIWMGSNTGYIIYYIVLYYIYGKHTVNKRYLYTSHIYIHNTYIMYT